MKNQYEQHCNAAALKELGVPVLKSLKEKHLPLITEWLKNDERIKVNYPDETEIIIDDLLQMHATGSTLDVTTSSEDDFDVKKFKNLTIRRIISKLGS